MQGTYQRGPNGQSIPATEYPPIPDAELFFTGRGYEKPAAVHYWCWRTDFMQWGACVTFSNGWHGVTNPQPSRVPMGMTLDEIKQCVQAGAIVHWRSKAYRVIVDTLGQWFIMCTLNSDCIGLTHRDGITMNGQPEDFFLGYGE